MYTREKKKRGRKRQGLSLVHYSETGPLFTVEELKSCYGSRSSERTILNVLHRLKKQGRVRAMARGVYAGASASIALNCYAVSRRVRQDAVAAFHSALEFHGVANQGFQTVYYLSARYRRDAESVAKHLAGNKTRQ